MTNNHFWDYTWKQKLFSMSQGSTLSIWNITSWHYWLVGGDPDRGHHFATEERDKGWFGNYSQVVKAFRSWHYNIKTWQHDKQSLLRLDMKTKVVQHVPRISIKHLAYDIWHYHFLVPIFWHSQYTKVHFPVCFLWYNMCLWCFKWIRTWVRWRNVKNQWPKEASAYSVVSHHMSCP